jgi:Mg-chelatase subunit ChlD
MRMRTRDRTRLIFLGIVGTAVLVIGALLIVDGDDQQAVPNMPAPGTTGEGAGDTPVDGAGSSVGPVEILFWTNDTKASWVITVTQRFNEQQHRLDSGKVVHVAVQQGDSPDALRDMQAGTLQPAAFSPGDASWVNQANETWEDLHGQPLVRDECPQLVYGDEVREAFRELELQTYHYGTSTRRLCEAMAAHGPAYLHAISTSEINVQACNYYQPNLRYPLVFIAPEEGTFWSDNPYCLVDADWVTAEQREAAELYRDYLLGEEAQQIAIDEWLRPVDQSIALRPPIDRAHGVDPAMTPATVPSLLSVSGETTDAIIDLFYQTKRPATLVVLLDTSQSMEGEKLNRALSAPQRFLDFLERDDEVTIYRFGDDVVVLEPAGRVGEVKESLRDTVGSLFAEGNTVLYDAICEGIETLQEQVAEDEATGEPHLYGVVLLSDGQDTNSERSESEMMYSCLPATEAMTGIKVFTIAYGDDADGELLTRIANRTNANSYTAAPETIEAIYEQIAFEQ